MTPMPIPNFKGHVFAPAPRWYRCVHCQMAAVETTDSYEFSLPDMFAIVSKRSAIKRNSSVPACLQVQINHRRAAQR